MRRLLGPYQVYRGYLMQKQSPLVKRDRALPIILVRVVDLALSNAKPLRSFRQATLLPKATTDSPLGGGSNFKPAQGHNGRGLRVYGGKVRPLRTPRR